MMRAALALIPLTSLIACAAPRDDYPSLLPRPIEKRGFADPERRPVPVATPDAALDARVGRQRAALMKAHAAFDTKAEEAERVAARARNVAAGSEGWIAAQVVLADLDTLRSGTAGALADIERLAIDRASAGNPAYPALEKLLADARAQNQAEIDRIGRIAAMMRAA